VVPPILLDQWYKEIYKITGHNAFIYHGLNKKKLDIGINCDAFKNARIVITTYNTIALNKKDAKIGLMHKIKWNRVIFDEAHHLRNKNTTRFVGSYNIRAINRWLLTGTPIQNKKTDFIHLCFILIPHLLNKKKETKCSKEELIKNIKEKHVLKRTKEMVGLDLKPYKRNDCKVEWKSNDEKQFAQEIHSLVKVSKVDEKFITTFSKQIGYGFSEGKASKLMAILRAKQSCIMTSLMKKTVEWLVDTSKINKKYLIPIENGCSNSKLDKVLEIIKNRKDNQKGKIVFCQFREEMNYLLDKLLQKGFKSIIIDGRCTGKRRLLLLEQQMDVLILQIQTGCEGLNLQEFYSEVYFVSPHWNPSVEDQAIARCHRLGQTKEVEVFKFEMNGFDEEQKTISLETYIKGVQGMKRELSF
jgi:SNF2 family DNA or RNA helicase